MREQTVPPRLVAGSQVSLQLPFSRFEGRGSWKKFLSWGTRFISKEELARSYLEEFPVPGWFWFQSNDREPGSTVSHLQDWHLQGRGWLRAWGLLHVVHSSSDCLPGSGQCRSCGDVQVRKQSAPLRSGAGGSGTRRLILLFIHMLDLGVGTAGFLHAGPLVRANSVTLSDFCGRPSVCASAGHLPLFSCLLVLFWSHIHACEITSTPTCTHLHTAPLYTCMCACTSTPPHAQTYVMHT